MLIRPAKDVMNSRTSSRRHVTMRFPSDIGAHCMVLNFKDYSYDATRSQITDIITKSSIVLPLPANLQDTYTLNASPANLGMGGAITRDAINSFAQGTANERAASIAQSITNGSYNASMATDGITNAMSDIGSYAKIVARSAVDMLPTGAGAAIDIATGTAINPHTSINFEGVALKSHSFNWTFSPKDMDESDTLLQIQNAIRRAILPSYKGITSADGTSVGQALLKYPNLVDIFLLGIDQNYYYHFKPAIVKQFEMNFSGGSQSPAILKGGKPAIVTMTLQLDETQIHTADDYT